MACTAQSVASALRCCCGASTWPTGPPTRSPTCREGSDAAWTWPAGSCTARTCCCSTSQPRALTPLPGARSGRPFSNCGRKKEPPCCWPRTSWTRRSAATVSAFSQTASWWPTACRTHSRPTWGMKPSGWRPKPPPRCGIESRPSSACPPASWGRPYRWPRPDPPTFLSSLYEALGDHIRSATIRTPTLEDVFMVHAGVSPTDSRERVLTRGDMSDE
jgi:hypothetical protein